MPSEPIEPGAGGTLDDTDAVAAGLLRGLMRATNLSLAEVARLAGLPLLVVAEWSTGRNQPSLGALIRVV